jgi:MoCo/4Fe-4S cofactor protein with predicted Tat translocation signal
LLDVSSINVDYAGQKGGDAVADTFSSASHDDSPFADQPKQLWRSLEELSESDELRHLVEREFPAQASEWTDATSRRQFLQLMGASLALAGLSGCGRQPTEKIVPYVTQPEQIVPGQPLYYATAMTLGGVASGLLVENHMGRPTKVEGNPRHPASPPAIDDARAATLSAEQRHTVPGATDIFAQAAVLTLYDPDRSQTVLDSGQISTWDSFLANLQPRLDAMQAKRGAGLRVLTETIISPTFAAQLNELLEKFPEAVWHQHEPVNRDNARHGALVAFGEDVNAVYDFRRADVVLALDADFLTNGPGHLRHARDFIERRNVLADGTLHPVMNRLYVVESTPTVTGAKADHRLSLRSSTIATLASALAAKLGVEVPTPDESHLRGVPAGWVDAVVEDLKSYRKTDGDGASLIVAGPWQPPLVHALAHAMNDRLGNVGKTVVYTEPLEANPVSQTDSLRELVTEMRGGKVELLFILGANPIFTAPADFDFAEALDKVPYRIHSGLYADETAQGCHWHIPETYFLESWSDALAYDGTASIVQPLIAPLYGSRSPHEVLAALLGQPKSSAHDMVQKYWKQRRGQDGFDDWWQIALHDGVIPETKLPAKTVHLQPLNNNDGQRVPKRTPSSDLEIVFRPDPTIGDGRFANNAWLQELPKPLTTLTWDNAALISPVTAQRLKLSNEEIVELQQGGRALRMPVWILPGQPEDSVTVHLGYGRTRAGQVGTGAGFNAYLLRASDSLWFAPAAELRKTGDRYALACTQHHHLMEGRHLVRTGTLGELLARPQHPEFMGSAHSDSPKTSFYPEVPSDGYKWAMSINLGSCIGCNACVVACQAENNIPVVGKDQVALGREMHWIRVDRYFEGDPATPATHFQPVPCMHCELAPCEPVCPVAATTHSSEGLNEMTYNRCVGTRYCSNNCPYKVRRFNFLHYTQPVEQHPSLKLLQNPDVTVRARGVMEKCTYCVQRINQARITAEKEGRSIRDGEVITACQAACPSSAIVFGDLNDPRSHVSQLKDNKQNPLDYALLGELNTRPRTTYCASVSNPNPRLKSG